MMGIRACASGTRGFKATDEATGITRYAVTRELAIWGCTLAVKLAEKPNVRMTVTGREKHWWEYR